MNFVAVTGTALKEVKLQWVIPSDFTPNDLDDTENQEFDIYRSKKEIQGENDLATATKVATVGISGQSVGDVKQYSDKSGEIGQEYFYAVRARDAQNNTSQLALLQDSVISKGYTLKGTVVDAVKNIDDEEVLHSNIDIFQDGNPLYVKINTETKEFTIEARKVNGSLLIKGEDIVATEVPYTGGIVTEEKQLGDVKTWYVWDAPFLQTLDVYRTGENQDVTTVTLFGTGEQPTIYWNLGLDPGHKARTYEQHNKSNKIMIDIAGDYLTIEPLKEGTNTFDEDPPPADAAAEFATRDRWTDDLNFQSDKKILINGVIYTATAANFVDENGRGYVQVKNSLSNLEFFWAEKYSLVAGGTSDSFLPYWDDTIISQNRTPESFPLSDGPKSNVGYNGKVVSKERLLIEMTHGIGNNTKLSKENGLRKIIHATRQLN